MNKEMQEVFKKLGLNEKQIKQANALHKLAVNQEQKKGGGAAAVPTEAEIQKMFDFDDKTMADLKKAHEATLKQNQLALRKTQKNIKGGGQGTELVSMAVGIAVPTLIGIPGGKLGFVAFQVAWRIISQALNKYVDGLPLDNSHLGYIAKLMTWVLPLGAIQYFINITLFDQTKLGVATVVPIFAPPPTAAPAFQTPIPQFMRSYASDQSPNLNYNLNASSNQSILSDIKSPDLPDAAAGTINPDAAAGMFANIGSEWTKWTEGKTGLTKGIIYIIDSLVASLKFLIDSAKGAGTAVGTKFGEDPTLVVVSAIVVAFIGKYMYTRFYGSKDQNKDLDKTLYMNWKRRRMIIKAYENRKTREKRELEDRQERYKQKEEELLERLEQGEEPEEPKEEKEEKKSEEIVRKNPVWYGYKITDDDRDEFYQKSFKKTASRKKIAKSDDDDKEAGSQQDDAEFLKKAEEILEKK